MNEWFTSARMFLSNFKFNEKVGQSMLKINIIVGALNMSHCRTIPSLIAGIIKAASHYFDLSKDAFFLNQILLTLGGFPVIILYPTSFSSAVRF